MYFILANKQTPEIEKERADDTTGFEVISYADDLDGALGLIYINIKAVDPEFYTYYLVRVMDDKGYEHSLFLRYDFEPEDNWVRLNPHQESLNGYVTSPGKHYRPNSHKLVQEFMAKNNLKSE